nr:amidohydrolase family protein [Nesterenkonia sp. PF2B19]
MVDTIITGARIRPMTSQHGAAEAAETALAVADGRITHLGTDEEIRALAGPGTEIIDAAGAVLTPGLIDSHMHPVWGAELAVGLDLDGLTELAQVRQAVAAAAAELPPGGWIRGWNLDYKAFDGHGIRGDLLDEASAGHPLA